MTDIIYIMAVQIDILGGFFIRYKMRIYLKEQDYFTFRGVGSSRLDLLGLSVYEHMMTRLQAYEDQKEGDRVVLYPVYPFLTREKLFSYLEEREGSYYFPGGYVLRSGHPISGTCRHSFPDPGRGLFTIADYSALLKIAAKESARLHMRKGALIEEGAEVSFTSEIGEGAIIGKGARILGASVIEKNAEISGDSCVEDSIVGENTVVISSRIIKSEIGADCRVGPNAFLRPGSKVGDGCRIGNFVELKNALIGNQTKIAHLAYVGDAEVGDRVNIGCGAVFVNYDGSRKQKSVVGNDCFIGSNCNLIAPVTLHDHSFVAAGTTLTKDLAENDFCIGRVRETVKPNQGRKYYDSDPNSHSN